jgi:hypothetical protein
MKSMFLVLSVILFSSAVLAQIPNTMSYQGVIKDAGGVVVADGDYNITFSLYTVESGGSPVWQEVNSVNVKNGIFNVILGKYEPIEQDFDVKHWMGIKIGSEEELAPRIELTTSPYSFRSKNSELVNGFEASVTPAPYSILPLDGSGNFPLDIVPRIGMDGVMGSSTINITTTAPVEILNLPVNTKSTKDVFINAQIVVETNANQLSKRYEFSIRRNEVNGEYVGARGWWRVTGTSESQYFSDTINLTVVDKDASSRVTYYLVARKFDSTALDARTFIHSLNVFYIEK